MDIQFSRSISRETRSQHIIKTKGKDKRVIRIVEKMKKIDVKILR